MKNIKLELRVEVSKKAIEPVVGMIVKTDLHNKYRLIVKDCNNFIAIDLITMMVADQGENDNDLACLRVEANPIIIGKLCI